jgi:chromosome segregation ATPase
MANLRAEIQRKATGAFLQYALFRLESAVIVAGTIILAGIAYAGDGHVWVLPWWLWLILGLAGWVAIIVSSVTDPDTSAKVLSQMLQARLDVTKIKDKTLRERAKAMGQYIRSAETDLYKLKNSTKQPVFEEAVEDIYTWVQQGTLFARYVDTYGRDYRLDERRAELPRKIETLVARLRYEKNPDIIERLNQEMATLGRDLQNLKLLDAQVQQAEPQLGQMLTALARVASELHVIAGEDALAQDHMDHLRQEIQRYLGQMTDLANQMEQLYTDALDKT